VIICVAAVVEAAAGEIVADVEAIAVAAPMELTIARQHHLQAHYLQAIHQAIDVGLQISEKQVVPQVSRTDVLPV
jgi:hypothetical protein